MAGCLSLSPPPELPVNYCQSSQLTVSLMLSSSLAQSEGSTVLMLDPGGSFPAPDVSCVLSVLAGKVIHSMVAHLDAVTSLAVDPNGIYLMSGSKSCISTGPPPVTLGTLTTCPQC